MEKFLVLGIAIMALTIIYICIGRKNIKTKILTTMFGGAIAVFTLVYPLLEESDIKLSIVKSFYFALDSIKMGQDMNILSKIDLNTRIGLAYFTMLNLLFISLPVLTISAILAFLSDAVAKLQTKTILNKNLVVFSERNEKSILIAKDLKERKKHTAIIFANCDNKEEYDDEKLPAFSISSKITDIHLSKRKNITLYMISENESQNLDDALEIIDKYKSQKIKMYVVNSSIEAPVILDTTEKGEITVEIVNENERAVFNLLDTKPLYLEAVRKTISVLIVGCGNLGKEFLKDATWCGMMIGYRFKATVIDINADKIKENIEAEAPDFLNNYKITFVNADIKSKKAIEEIKRARDINYILVSMENDNKNLDAAIYLRRLFIKAFERKPIINICIQNEYKREQINRLMNEKGKFYEINTFGSIKDMYYDNRIVDSEIEKMAEKIHLSYEPEDIELKKYNKNEYNKRSSRASALHVKYKLYSVLREHYTNDTNQNLQLFREIYSEELEEILSQNEHDRWNAYMRSVGYTLASIDDVKKYYPIIGDHRDFLGRRHPALVDYDELDKVTEELRKFADVKDMKQNDHDIVKNMLNDF